MTRPPLHHKPPKYTVCGSSIYRQLSGTMRKTTLCLPEDLVVRLRQLAKRVGRPSAALVREAVQRYVSVEEAPAPKSVGGRLRPGAIRAEE